MASLGLVPGEPRFSTRTDRYPNNGASAGRDPAERKIFAGSGILAPDEDSVKLYDKVPPDHGSRLAISYLRLPPVDWSDLSVAALVEAGMHDERSIDSRRNEGASSFMTRVPSRPAVVRASSPALAGLAAGMFWDIGLPHTA
jgi:hypothetical protein